MQPQMGSLIVFMGTDAMMKYHAFVTVLSAKYKRLSFESVKKSSLLDQCDAQTNIDLVNECDASGSGSV